MSVVAAINWKAAIAGRANRDFAGRLISDISIDVGIDQVLSRRVEFRKRRAKLLPILCRIHMKKWIAESIIKRPSQSYLPRFARSQVTHNGTVSCDLHIDNHVPLVLHVNN